ncbi:MAG TPA: TlpA family protein disulfide reductase [Deltaproteobacteria bacterium]|nr:TlpA family protein disulfide reductase [Deltaproteobacteria bacterium]
MHIMKYIAVSLVIVVGATFMVSMKDMGAVLAAAPSSDKKSDRLYRDLGMLKVPRIASPVDFKLKDMNGKWVWLSDFKGKVVFLNFWATWCPPCKYEMPSMQKLYDKLKHKKFAMVAVDLQEPVHRVKDFVKAYKLSFTVLLDSKGDVGRQFGISSIPTTFILDGRGGIIGKAFGPREWDGKKAVDFFEHLMTQEKE